MAMSTAAAAHLRQDEMRNHKILIFDMAFVFGLGVFPTLNASMVPWRVCVCMCARAGPELIRYDMCVIGLTLLYIMCTMPVPTSIEHRRLLFDYMSSIVLCAMHEIMSLLLFRRICRLSVMENLLLLVEFTLQIV